ncbi:MAG TPA: TQO small subunit DoxD [Thermoplasmata archaeon]|nr:TQO small subunit DoxD [Thermoplasmata archaeon]
MVVRDELDASSEKGFHRALLPLRFVLAFVWIMGGVLNAYDSNVIGGQDRYEQLIGVVWADGVSIQLPVPSTLYLQDAILPNPVPGMAWFLSAIVAPNARVFMTTMALLEIAVGAAILTGSFTRLATMGAVLMNATILLAAGHTHPAILRVNLLMAGAAFTLFLARAGRYYAVDPWLSRRVSRWPLLRKACAR